MTGCHCRHWTPANNNLADLTSLIGLHVSLLRPCATQCMVLDSLSNNISFVRLAPSVCASKDTAKCYRGNDSTCVEGCRSACGVLHPCAFEGVAVRVKGGRGYGVPGLTDECQPCDGLTQTLHSSLSTVTEA